MFASIEESPFQYIPLPQNARSYNEIYMDLKNCRQKQKICVRDKFARQRPHVWRSRRILDFFVCNWQFV